MLTQYKAQSLTEHIQRGWSFGTFLSDYFITLVPAQMYRFEELGPVWYRGTADAVYQNLHLVDNHDADYVAIFCGDHIYKMNVEHMLQQHIDSRADITHRRLPDAAESGAPVRHHACRRELEGHRLSGKTQRPAQHSRSAGHEPDQHGQLYFLRRALEELLETSMSGGEEGFDFGKDVIPRALSDGYNVMAYDFHNNPIPGQARPNLYWRDVGTLDAYFEANMDLVTVNPEFDIYNAEWPLRTSSEFSPPAKFVHESEGGAGRPSTASWPGAPSSPAARSETACWAAPCTATYSVVESCGAVR